MCLKWSSIGTEGLNCDCEDWVRASPKPQVLLDVSGLQGFVPFYEDNQI